MNFGSLPRIPTPPAPPAAPVAPSAPAIPTRLGQDVGAGPAQGNVGIGAPQHFDPNNPSVRLDGTLHNPTGVGGDLHVSREVSVNDLKKIPVPDPSLPDLPGLPDLPSFGGSSGGSSGGGFSLPSIGNPLSGLGMPSMPSLPDMPSLGNPFSGLEAPSLPSLGNPFSGLSAPDLPSFGNPFSGLSLPDFSLPDLPSVGTPGMPGFRFLDLPEISLPDFDMGEWDLPLPDLVPDWGGDSEESQEEPHKNVQKKGRLKVDLVLETDDGVGIPRVAFRVSGVNGFSLEGALDREGKAQVEVPRGPYRVEYLDEEAIQAKILAAEFAKAIRHEDFLAIPELLDDASDCLSPVGQAYSAYFAGNPDAKLKNDLEDLYTKKGRREEFDLVWSHLGNGVRSLQVIDADEDDEP